MIGALAMCRTSLSVSNSVTGTDRGGALPRRQGAVPPAQHPQRPQRVPAAGLAVAFVHLEVDRAWMGVLEQPPAVGLALALDELDRLAHPLVRRSAGRSEVLEPAEHVVEPAGRERELQER